MYKVKFHKVIFAIIFIHIFVACSNTDTSSNWKGKRHAHNVESKNTMNIDSLDFYCRIEGTYAGEGIIIQHCKLTLTDSISILSGQAVYERSAIQVSLTKPVSDYIKSLLKSIYSKHKSAIKDEYLNANYGISSVTLRYDITMNMGGKRICETIDVIGYELTFDAPFHPQFDRLLELISVIIVKMEQDIFEVEYSYHRNKPAEWITEMFHDEYYLPYNDINSHNYQ